VPSLKRGGESEKKAEGGRISVNGKTIKTKRGGRRGGPSVLGRAIRKKRRLKPAAPERRKILTNGGEKRRKK